MASRLLVVLLAVVLCVSVCAEKKAPVKMKKAFFYKCFVAKAVKKAPALVWLQLNPKQYKALKKQFKKMGKKKGFAKLFLAKGQRAAIKKVLKIKAGKVVYVKYKTLRYKKKKKYTKYFWVFPKKYAKKIFVLKKAKKYTKKYTKKCEKKCTKK